MSWRSSSETAWTERYRSKIQQAAVYTAAPAGEASVLSTSCESEVRILFLNLILEVCHLLRKKVQNFSFLEARLLIKLLNSSPIHFT